MNTRILLQIYRGTYEFARLTKLARELYRKSSLTPCKSSFNSLSHSGQIFKLRAFQSNRWQVNKICPIPHRTKIFRRTCENFYPMPKKSAV